MEALWGIVVKALDEGTAEHQFVLDASKRVPVVSSNVGVCLSAVQGRFLASEACRRGNTDVLEFLFRLGFSSRLIDVSAVCEKGDLACARILHEQFNISFSSELLKKALLNGCSELASYMLETADPPYLSVEDAKQLLIHAAGVHRNAHLIAIITLACHRSVSAESIIEPIAEQILAAILVGDHDPEEDIERRLAILTFLLERFQGVVLPEFYTNVASTDPKIPQDRRKALLVTLYLQSLIQSWSNYCVAPWCKRNLYACVPDVLFLAGQPLPLVDVDMSRNFLTSLPGNLFDGSLPTLKRLHVDHNELYSLHFDEEVDFSKSCLQEVDFSSNKLTHVPQFLAFLPALIKVNLSSNEITAEPSEPQDSFLEEVMATSLETHLRYGWTDSTTHGKSSPALWTSIHLEILNLSKNKLTVVPLFVANLPFLSEFDVSFNQLNDLTIVHRSCVRLTKLNVSFNPLSDEHMIPIVFSSVENTPTNSKHLLLKVELSDAKLKSFPRELSTLKVLEHLDLSNNLIDTLPNDLHWDCRRLVLLNLASNMFGQGCRAGDGGDVEEGQPNNPTNARCPHGFQSGDGLSEPSLSSQLNFKHAHEMFVLPAEGVPALLQLNLRNNNFTKLPASICDLTSLATLDLSNNRCLRRLPPALGQLKNLFILDLTGCMNMGLLEQIKEFRRESAESPLGFNPELGTSLRTRDFITHLRRQYRHEGHYYSLKLAVIGNQGVGKTQLLDAIRHRNGKGISHHHNVPYSCEQGQLTLNASGAVVPNVKLNEMDQGQQVTFSTFDMSNIEVLTAFRHLFFSARVLFLVVWNIEHKESGIEAARSWVHTVRAINCKAEIMVVATHCDKGRVFDSERINVRAYCERSSCHPICEPHFVNSSTGHNIAEFRRHLFKVAWDCCERLPMYPRSYIQLARHCMSSKTQTSLFGEDWNDLSRIVSAELFQKKMRGLDIASCDLNSDEQFMQVSIFLNEILATIHFEDTFSQLNGFYFMSPDWVREAVLRLLNEKHLLIDGGILTMKGLKVMYEREVDTSDKFQAFIALLEKGRILFRISNGRKKRFLVPSALPKQRPVFQSMILGYDTEDSHSPCVERIYSFKRFPAEIWGLLVSQLLVKLEKWSQLRYSEKSFKGQRLNTVSWATGILGFLPDSIFLVEGLEGVQVHGHTILFPGIIIKVHSVTKDFAVMTLIVQHVNELLRQWFHDDHNGGLSSEHGEEVMTVVPCPACCSMYFLLASQDSGHAFTQSSAPPGQKVKSSPPHFFLLSELAGLLAHSKPATCQYKQQDIPLEDLIPDLMFCDLPRDKVLQRVENLPAKPVASGGFGSVYKCRIFGEDVAVKVYTSSVEVQSLRENLQHVDNSNFSLSNTLPSDFSNIGLESNLSSIGEPMLHGLAEAEHEVSRLTRLRHPCVVSFLKAGILPPSLLMEFAPLGSLGSFIQKKLEEEKEALLANVAGEGVLVDFPDGVLGRSLTIQVAYQVALGLQHIHQQGIIYRDLKADNVLLFSLNTECIPNVKLTDYGIAGENLPGGVRGTIGTVGYQAPEILLDATQTNKIDIYAYAMFLVELLDGRIPFEQDRVFSAIVKNQVLRGVRPTLVSRPSLVQIEDLMKSCWTHSPDRRPAASSIVQKLRRPQMACQHQYLLSVQQAPDTMHFFSACAVNRPAADATKAALEQRIMSRKVSSRLLQSLSPKATPGRSPCSPNTAPKLSKMPSMPTSPATSHYTSSSRLPLFQELLFVSFPVGGARLLAFVNVGTDNVVSATELSPGMIAKTIVHCGAAVDNLLWLSTGGIDGSENQIAVYSLEEAQLCKRTVFSTDRPVICFHGHTLPDKHEDRANKKKATRRCVLAGLPNGTVALFFRCQHHAPSSKSAFTIGSTTWVRSDLRCLIPPPKMITCFVSVAGAEVWCGVGSKITILQLRSDTQTCEEMKNVDFNGSELDPAHHILSMSHIGQHVWAIVNYRVPLLKFDVAKQQLLGWYDLNVATTHELHFSYLPFNPGMPVSVTEFSDVRHRSPATMRMNPSNMLTDRCRSPLAQRPYFSKGPPSQGMSMVDVHVRGIEDKVNPQIPESAPTCLLAVDDSLWVGQQNGDILVLDCSPLIDQSNRTIHSEDDDKYVAASAASNPQDDLCVRMLARLQLPQGDKRCSCPVQKLVKVPSGRVVVARNLTSLPVTIGSMDTWEAWDKQRWEDFHRQNDRLDSLSKRH